MIRRKINIIYATNAIVPSSTANSIQVMKMCNSFATQGNRVTLLARPGKDKINKSKSIYEFYGVKDSFKIISFPFYHNNLKALIKFLPKNTYFILCVIYILFLKPNLIYGRSARILYLLTLMGKEVVYEAHNLPDTVEANNLLNSKKLKNIVVTSDKLKEKLKSKVKYAKIIVAHNGADNEFSFGENKEINWIGRQNVLQAGYMGHLYNGKGMEILAPLATVFPDIDFHVIGGLAKDIEYWKKKCLVNNVYFHGFVPHGELLPYYKKIEIFLAPYQKHVHIYGGKRADSDYMCSLKVFEYMAEGKAILASRTPVIEEVLKDGENALLCDPDNLDDWVKALKTLHEDNLLRKKLGENAKNTLEEKYTWDKRSAGILSEIFIETINNKK